jgi:hypothetical protein
MGDTTYVTKYPSCDICKYEQSRTSEAHYDGRTTSGQWAYMCATHFASRGLGLGTGKGQRLIVGDKPVDTDEERRRKVRQYINQGDFDAAEEAIGDGDPADFF